MDGWSRGRVVLLGDAAWCATLYSGMGASAGLAGADLLGTMLECHRGDIGAALSEWEGRLRPFITECQQAGVQRRLFFTPGTRMQIAIRPLLARAVQLPLLGPVLNRMAARQRNRQQSDAFTVPSAASAA